jgi:hypothetical protein
MTKFLPPILVVLALAGCASPSLTPVSGNGPSMMERADRPVILFVKAPPSDVMPQQIIGEEVPHLVLDGLS